MRVKHVCKPAKIDPLLQVLTADLDLTAVLAGTVRAPLPSVQRPWAGGEEGAALSLPPLPAPLDLGFLRAWSLDTCSPGHLTRCGGSESIIRPPARSGCPAQPRV